jgi:hypothetical protein
MDEDVEHVASTQAKPTRRAGMKWVQHSLLLKVRSSTLIVH